MPVEKICKSCGVEIVLRYPSDARRTFCGRPCFARFYGASRSAVMVAKLRGQKAHNNARIHFACHQCGKDFTVPPSRARSRKLCSKACADAARRSKHPTKHPATMIDGKVRYDHVRLAEKVLGRPLDRSEIVHHIDGKIGSNSLTNLIVLHRRDHTRLHSIERWYGGLPSAEEILRDYPNALWLGDARIGGAGRLAG